MPEWHRRVLVLAGTFVAMLGMLTLLSYPAATAAPALVVDSVGTPLAPGADSAGALFGLASRSTTTTTTTAVPQSQQPSPADPTPSSTTVPPPTPAPSAPPPAPAPTPVARVGILPPANPSSNIAPQPNFLASCSGTQYDDSGGCVGATLQAIDNARQAEGVGPMNLPGNWSSLDPQEQLFVATNLERTARGLPAIAAMAAALDEAAASGAASNSDPAPPPGFGFTQWGSNWAGAVGNPLEAIYYWMYDDGPGSSNIDCTASNSSGCWGHRDNVLLEISCSDCLMGVGFAPSAYQGAPSWTQVLVEATGSWPEEFTWQQA
jgi:hypothetical protein